MLGESRYRHKSGELRNYKKTQRDWVQTNDACRRDILRRLGSSGPLKQSELPDTCVKPWASNGWNNYKNVAMMLEFITQRGEVAIAGRNGRDRSGISSSVCIPTPPSFRWAKPSGSVTRNVSVRLVSPALAGRNALSSRLTSAMLARQR